MLDEKQRVIVGAGGTTGLVYAGRALAMLRSINIETHLVVNRPGPLLRSDESSLGRGDLEGLADVAYAIDEVGAPISFGTFATLGMLIAPCSMRSLGEIASGATTSLLTRAAAVTLRARRRLVLMVREAPLTLSHIRDMATITEAGGVIFPPVPAFYMRPTTVDELVDHSVGLALNQFGIHVDAFPSWNHEFRSRQLDGAAAEV